MYKIEFPITRGKCFNGKWRTGLPIGTINYHGYNCVDLYNYEDDEHFFIPNPETIKSTIGLEDIKELMIYEGDIVEQRIPNTTGIKRGFVLYGVRYDEVYKLSEGSSASYYIADLTNKNTKAILTYGIAKCYEITGTIFDSEEDYIIVKGDTVYKNKSYKKIYLR